jgi:hypothetical protein
VIGSTPVSAVTGNYPADGDDGLGPETRRRSQRSP